MEDQLTMETGESATTQRVALEEALRDRPRTRFSLRHQMIMRSLSSAPGSRRRALSQNLVAALLVVLVLVAAGCSNSAATPLAPTSTVTSDEQAANGPLVGDTSKYASEQACAAAENNQPWYATITAFEHHDVGFLNCLVELVVVRSAKGTKNLGRTFITIWDTCNGDFEMERASRENFGRGIFR